ncbi:hypothetical protein LSAT2_024046 [Lamellibrachia satsuma]|nr:hypothetical protein LSAT2_024046 [Lamellibrachia satsuma]
MGCTWDAHLANRQILVSTDNTAVVEVINKHTSKYPPLVQLIRHFVVACMQHNVAFRARHIPGKLNIVADMITRLQMSRARKKHLKSLIREHGTVDDRHPLSKDDPKKLMKALRHIGCSIFAQALLGAMFVLMFYGFLRINDVTKHQYSLLIRHCLAVIKKTHALDSDVSRGSGVRHGATCSSASSLVVYELPVLLRFVRVHRTPLCGSCVVYPACPAATTPSNLETLVSRTTDRRARCRPGRQLFHTYTTEREEEVPLDGILNASAGSNASDK